MTKQAITSELTEGPYPGNRDSDRSKQGAGLGNCKQETVINMSRGAGGADLTIFPDVSINRYKHDNSLLLWSLRFINLTTEPAPQTARDFTETSLRLH